MTNLVLIATGFQPPTQHAPDRQQSRLPHLERVLALAQRRHLNATWRDWLAASVAPRELAEFSLAAIAGAAFRGRAIPQPEHTGYWLATPVHLFAGLDSVHVHPSGLLQLTADEQQALVQDFAHVFADSPWRLESIGRRELLLSGPCSEAEGADPSMLVGADLAAGTPRGEGAGALRRLGSEIEMWLHGHAINQQREARRELVVIGLWLWGARAPAPVSTFRLRQAQLYGHDIYAEALCQLLRLKVRDLSEGLRAIEDVPIGIASDTVVLMQSLSQLEQQAIGPALQAVRQRRLTLHVIAGRDLFTLPARRLLQWWRRSRPWWEVLS